MIQVVPLSQWAMDVLGPMPKTENGNQSILVLTDLFIKWVELFALPDQKSNQIAECLMQAIKRYSIPKTILTDNGTNFKSGLVQKLLQWFQVKPIYTTAYHPQTDGQCERFNSTLLQTLRKLIEDKPDDWHRHIQ